jgi:hypothetical protein
MSASRAQVLLSASSAQMLHSLLRLRKKKVVPTLYKRRRLGRVALQVACLAPRSLALFFFIALLAFALLTFVARGCIRKNLLAVNALDCTVCADTNEECGKWRGQGQGDGMGKSSSDLHRIGRPPHICPPSIRHQRLYSHNLNLLHVL